MVDKLWFILPELWVFLGVIVVFVLGLSPSKRVRDCLPWITSSFLALAVLVILHIYDSSDGKAHVAKASFLLMPMLGKYVKIVVCLLGIVLSMLSVGLVDRRLETAVESGRLIFDPIRAN